jgi:hypothetical protein
MAKRIDAGSLVSMSRRVIGGQGLVIQRIKDINLYAEFDLSEAWLKMYDKSNEDYFFKDANPSMILWSLRRDLRDEINDKIQENNPSIRMDLLNEFWNYNSAYSYQKNGSKILTPKTDFCLVRWFKAPSDYGDKPSKWFKNRQCWLHTRMLKNIT